MKVVLRDVKTNGDLLLEASFEFCSDDPVLGPFAAVDVPLGVVITDRLFLGDIIGVTCKSCTFGGWKVWSLRRFRAWCEER